ncbi:hypothetical protein [Flavobacterium pectinovorum]|uniref:Uncharacterized protein n=1 Tax=Flavobacterium pectinovorum TaxID=29533 RepID=A0A502E3R9_9FLAO|nr:hypothetical protein [Flavobacterium pectinovorum]TPG31080.1 hypothetical protein EAH81_27060 [Flavobacterium pectinovorum]
MELENIRQQLISELRYSSEIWDDILSDTNPGNYGVNDWDVEIDESQFYADVPNRTFTFKNATFSGSLIMGASKGDSSFDMSFSKTANGSGKFDFKDSQNVQIDGVVDVDVDMDIFGDD